MMVRDRQNVGRKAQVFLLLLGLLGTACAGPVSPRMPGGVFALPVVATGPVAEAEAPVVSAYAPSSNARPTSAPTAAAAGRSGGGGARPAIAGSTVQVRDRQGVPVVGATVLFANGVTYSTGEAGTFVMRGPAPQATCVAFAPGHKTSVLAADGLPEVLHLDRLAAADPGFEPGEVTVRGKVSWPVRSDVTGVVLYQDDLNSVANPVVVDEEGNFAIRIETLRPGAPTGAVLALGTGADGLRLMGISRVFKVLEQGPEPVDILAVEAPRPVSFQVAAPPEGLPEVSHRLEIAVEGLAPFRMMGAGTTSGQYHLPAPGALEATVRISAEAENRAAGTRSVVTLDPEALPALAPAFLPPPNLEVQAAQRQARWTTAPDVSAVLLELSQTPSPETVYWEAWVEGRSHYRFDARDWPTGASASLRLVAFDGPEASVRHVAAVRQLRVLPEPVWRGGFRYAESRLPFSPQ